MPSGHVASTPALLGPAADQPAGPPDPGRGVLALLLAGLAGSGAGLAGVHFFSDVVAGLALGTLLLALHAPLAALAARQFSWGILLLVSTPGRLAHPVHHPGAPPCSPWGSMGGSNSNGTRLLPALSRAHCYPGRRPSPPGC